jgi:hypothetical protein
MWEAQPMNDLVAVKKKFGDKLAFTVHLDPAVNDNPDATEAEIVKAVRYAIDTYGENGGMVLFSMGSSPKATEIIARETFEYSRKKFGKI